MIIKFLFPIFAIFITQPAFANVFQKGNEDIAFQLRSAGSRPSWATGSKDGSLTCERSFGKTQFGVGTKLNQVIKFDNSVIQYQIADTQNFAFRWGNSQSSDGTYGTIGKVRSTHKLNLNNVDAFGVGLRGYMDTIEGKFFFFQTGVNSANTIVNTPKSSFAKVVAKCPDKYV
jgi:hypothetical protein